jgi:peroxiredoxin
VSGYPTEALEAGTEAPDFELKATPDQSVSLAEFRGRPKSQIQ